MGQAGIGLLVEKEVEPVEHQDSIEFATSLEGVEDYVVEFGEIPLDLSGVDTVQRHVQFLGDCLYGHDLAVATGTGQTDCSALALFIQLRLGVIGIIDVALCDR